MDVSKLAGGGLVTKTSTDDREQAQKNAMNMIQARYGERPKEQRQVHKQLDKDDFMKIMLSEMKHQDPTKPMDADKMATQMAQITSVEQMRNVGASMDKLVEKNNASDRLAMSAMIGKTVTVDKGKFTHTKGLVSPVSYALPEDAEKIKIAVMDEHGEEVFSRELEPQKAGPNTYNWDGIGAGGAMLKSGSYAIRIDAEKQNGAKIKIDPIAHDVVVGVSFDAGETNFLVGDLKQPQKVSMRNVIKIEGESMRAANQATSAPQASTTGETAVNPEAAKNNGFALPDSIKEKFAMKPAAEQEDVKAEGFPNGLKE